MDGPPGNHCAFTASHAIATIAPTSIAAPIGASALRTKNEIRLSVGQRSFAEIRWCARWTTVACAQHESREKQRDRFEHGTKQLDLLYRLNIVSGERL